MQAAHSRISSRTSAGHSWGTLQQHGTIRRFNACCTTERRLAHSTARGDTPPSLCARGLSATGGAAACGMLCTLLTGRLAAGPGLGWLRYISPTALRLEHNKGQAGSASWAATCKVQLQGVSCRVQAPCDRPACSCCPGTRSTDCLTGPHTMPGATPARHFPACLPAARTNLTR